MSKTRDSIGTGWTTTFPLEKTGHWWIKYSDGSVDTFQLNEYNSARPENFLDVVGWLGPISPLDFEQLTRLREAVTNALESLDAQSRHRCTYCAKEFEWDAEQNTHVFRAESDRFDGQLLSCRDLPLRLIADDLREALAHRKGE